MIDENTYTTRASQFPEYSKKEIAISKKHSRIQKLCEWKGQNHHWKQETGKLPWLKVGSKQHASKQLARATLGVHHGQFQNEGLSLAGVCCKSLLTRAIASHFCRFFTDYILLMMSKKNKHIHSIIFVPHLFHWAMTTHHFLEAVLSGHPAQGNTPTLGCIIRWHQQLWGAGESRGEFPRKIGKSVSDSWPGHIWMPILAITSHYFPWLIIVQIVFCWFLCSWFM